MPNVARYREYDQDPDSYPRDNVFRAVEAAVAVTDILICVPNACRCKNRQHTEHNAVAGKRLVKLKPQKVQEHPAYSAARAVQVQKFVDGAKQRKARQAVNNDISKAYSQDTGCRLCQF